MQGDCRLDCFGNALSCTMFTVFVWNGLRDGETLVCSSEDWILIFS